MAKEKEVLVEEVEDVSEIENLKKELEELKTKYNELYKQALVLQSRNTKLSELYSTVVEKFITSADPKDKE